MSDETVLVCLTVDPEDRHFTWGRYDGPGHVAECRHEEAVHFTASAADEARWSVASSAWAAVQRELDDLWDEHYPEAGDERDERDRHPDLLLRPEWTPLR